MILHYKKMHPDAKVPTYAHGPSEDAGADLYALEQAVLRPGVPVIIRTGIAIELPPFYEAQVRPRGGLAAKHGITVINSPGTVDPGYRGEIMIIVRWDGYVAAKKSISHQGEFVVNSGDRIAQLVVTRYEPAEYREVAELSDSLRGGGKFGSSGA